MSSAKYSRALNLSEEAIEQIMGILDGWSLRLTWDSLIDAIEMQLGVRYTRQALSKHQRIQSAFDLAKNRTSNQSPADANISIEMAHMIQKLKRIEAENERLHKENEELLAQFARWAYNAYNKGITKEILDVSLPQVERTKK